MIRSLFFFLFAWHLSADISALYLSWYADPTTTMAIHWHTPESEPGDTIYVQQANHSWLAISGSHEHLYHLIVHTVNLAQLQPDTEYFFRIGAREEVYKFRTAPKQGPIQFIIGGDADHTTKLFRKMNQTIVKKDPLFCVIGGDIAYALNRTPFQSSSRAFHRWISFLSIWKEQMVTQDGRRIPFLLCAGNHDIAKDNYELFFTLFPFPEKRFYRAFDFGKLFSLILLDTDHFEPIEGAQTAWLKQALSARMDTAFRFAIYHEAAYPSFYPYDGATPKKIRASWCPLFDQYQLSGAFENHNHALKRTYPIKNGEIDPNGIIYFGDGCWGVPPRKPNDLWYLETRARKNNVYFVSLDENKAHIEAIHLTGEVLDSVSLDSRRGNAHAHLKPPQTQAEVTGYYKEFLREKAPLAKEEGSLRE